MASWWCSSTPTATASHPTASAPCSRPSPTPDGDGVSGIALGGHITRTLLVDASNRLYVSIGSPAGGYLVLGAHLAPLDIVSDGDGGIEQGTWGVRPCSIRVDKNGLLVLTLEGAGVVAKIGYRP